MYQQQWHRSVPNQCRVCQGIFPSPALLREHLQSSGHRSAQPPPNNYRTSPANRMNQESARSTAFACSVCQQRFADWTMFNQHLSQQRHFQCRTCSQLFESKNSLKNHQATHVGLSAQHQSEPVMTPVFRHAQERSAATTTHNCTVCSAVFPSKQTLRDHMTSMGHYRCRECFQQFSSHAELTQHITFVHRQPQQRFDIRNPTQPPARSARGSPPPPPTSNALSQLSLSADEENQVVMEKTQALQSLPGNAYTSGSRKCFVYLDMDNIVFAMQNSHLYQHVPGASQPSHVRLDIAAFTECVRGSDPSKVEYMNAFYYGTNDRIANIFQHNGWAVTKQETVSDTTMQHQLLFNLVPCPANNEILRKTLVLITGDGNLSAPNASFLQVVERYLESNWYVEVHSWLHSLSGRYIEFQRQYPFHFVVKPLDNHISRILRSRVAQATSRTIPRQDMNAITSQMQALQATVQAIQNQQSADARQQQEQQVQRDELVARKLALDMREEHLRCPIALDLMDEPSVLSCCGKTCSAEHLRSIQSRRGPCPMCRSSSFDFFLNRNMVDIITTYREELQVYEQDVAELDRSSRTR